jgi:biopolymer transport protein ExbD/biopolymer transport protein TolR
VSPPVASQDGLRAEINVTPLVDVVLVLLVIFMVVTPLLRQEAPVELPISRHSQQANDTRQLTLAIGADGSLSLSGEALGRDRLAERLESIFRDRADKTLFLSADRSLAYASVVDVIDACREAGVTAIGLLTQKPVE